MLRNLEPAYDRDVNEAIPMYCPRCGSRAGNDLQSNYSYAFCMNEKKCGWNSTYSK